MYSIFAPVAARSFVAVTVLMTFVAAGLWLVWTLADLAFGGQAAGLAVVALLAGTFAISRRTGRTSPG